MTSKGLGGTGCDGYHLQTRLAQEAEGITKLTGADEKERLRREVITKLTEDIQRGTDHSPRNNPSLQIFPGPRLLLAALTGSLPGGAGAAHARIRLFSSGKRLETLRNAGPARTPVPRPFTFAFFLQFPATAQHLTKSVYCLNHWLGNPMRTATYP